MHHFFELLIHALLALPAIRFAIVPTPPPPPGFHGWGAGPGPTGLTNAPGVAFKPGFLPTSINNAFYVILGATGVPQQAQPVYVPPGALVSVRAHNGTDAGNAHIVRLGRDPDTLSGVNGDPITPDSDISWPCDNTVTMWVVGTEGDGVRVSIQAGRAA